MGEDPHTSVAKIKSQEDLGEMKAPLASDSTGQAEVKFQAESSDKDSIDRLKPFLTAETIARVVSTSLGSLTALIGAGALISDRLTLPSPNPISLYIHAVIEPYKANEDNNRWLKVILTASATNNTRRDLWLMKPHWILYGLDAAHQENASRATFIMPPERVPELKKALNQGYGVNPVIIDSGDYKDLRAHKHGDNKRFLGLGPLFNAPLLLRPNASTSTSRLVFIPQQPPADFFWVAVNIPSLTESPLLKTSGQISWSGNLFQMDGEASSIKKQDYGLYLWRNSFCEEPPFTGDFNSVLYLLSQYEVKPFTEGLNTHPSKIFSHASDSMKASGSKPYVGMMDGRFCQPSALGITPIIAKQIGAHVTALNFEIPIPVDGSKSEYTTKLQ